MHLRKVCPQCNTVIHARRSVYECGHAFTLKREARITASSPAKHKRAVESLEDTLRRQESNRTRMASMRASETQEQTLEKLEQNRTRIASMGASETLHVKLHKRRKNKEGMANACTRTMLIESVIAAFHSEANWDLSLSIFRMRHYVIIFVPHLQTDSDRCLYLECRMRHYVITFAN